MIRWAEPRRVQKPYVRGRWNDDAEQLRSYPGRWGVIWEAKSNPENDKYGQDLQATVRHGRVKAFAPAGAYEAAKRIEAEGKDPLYRELWVRVYVRYVGDGS